MSIFEDIESALKADKRTLFGIIGEPGAGKSTLVEQIKEKFPGNSVAVLPMDGFHLSNKVLIERGIRNIKGAPQTFDALGFVALLERVKENLEEDKYLSKIETMKNKEIKILLFDEFLRETNNSKEKNSTITKFFSVKS